MSLCCCWAADADLDGTIGVQGKLAKLKENDKKLKELASWEKADATVGTVRTAPPLPACIRSVVACKAQHAQTNLAGRTALRCADGATQVRTVAPGACGVHAEAL